jgi:hypothetical protein
MDLFGYYSALAAEEFGYVVYLTEAGEKVRVTCADTESSLQELRKLYKWEDVVSVGRVTTFVESFKHKGYELSYGPPMDLGYRYKVTDSNYDL